MKKRTRFTLLILFFGILFFAVNCNAAGKNPNFPSEKAKQAALASVPGGSVIGWHNEGNGKVEMYLFGKRGERYQRNFVLLESDQGSKWLMIIPCYGLKAGFQVIK